MTILATNATVPGKTIQLQDIQIVNGLQTTETIFRHFQDGSVTSRDSALLVKIVVSSDAQVRDRIIRATNNQSPVEVAALHATDKIQRDIEDILERHDWYYERRRNYYRNIGKPQARFVTPLYIASAVVALIFKNPARATRLKSRFMRTQSGYDAVFSEKIPIGVWPVLVQTYKEIDAGLTNVSSRKKIGEKFISRWRALVSLIVVARRLKTFSYSTAQLLEINSTPITVKEVGEVWDIIVHVSKVPDRTIRPNQTLVHDCCNEAASRYGLLGKEDIARREIPISPTVPASILSPLHSEFVTMVETLLPVQPWKPGIHMDIASKLNCKANKVSRAIQQLIGEGKFNNQRDGIVYSADGIVLMVDPERVSYSVEELNASDKSPPSLRQELGEPK